MVPACELAGKILARLQLARTENISPMPVDMVDRDLAMAPWRLSLWEKKKFFDLRSKGSPLRKCE